MQDNHGAAKFIRRLKSITLAVQLTPFVFSFVYIVCIILYLHCSEEARIWIDTIFYVSPLACAALLIYSKILHLCGWHKTACCVPLVPHVVTFTDIYLIELTVRESVIVDITIAVMAFLLIISAYKVFFYDK